MVINLSRVIRMNKKLLFLLFLLSTKISTAMEQTSAELKKVAGCNTVLETLISITKWFEWEGIPEDAKSKKLYMEAVNSKKILKEKFDIVHQQIDTNAELHVSDVYQELLDASIKFNEAATAFNDDKIVYNEWWKQHCLPYRANLSDSDEE